MTENLVTNPRAGVQNKVRKAGLAGIAATAAAFALSLVARRFGWADVTPEDAALLYDLGAAAFDAARVALGGLAAFWAAYRARPRATDFPVHADTGRPATP